MKSRFWFDGVYGLRVDECMCKPCWLKLKVTSIILMCSADLDGECSLVMRLADPVRIQIITFLFCASNCCTWILGLIPFDSLGSRNGIRNGQFVVDFDARSDHFERNNPISKAHSKGNNDLITSVSLVVHQQTDQQTDRPQR